MATTNSHQNYFQNKHKANPPFNTVLSFVEPLFQYSIVYSNHVTQLILHFIFTGFNF